MKYAFLLAGLLLLTHCTPMQPALTNSTNSATTSYPVKGRQGLLINQKLSFADYQTSKVKRSWTRGTEMRQSVSAGVAADILYPDLLSLGYAARNQTFHFTMADSAGNVASVYAASEFEAEDLQIGKNPNSVVNILEDVFGNSTSMNNLFYVQIYMNNSPEAWQLVLDNQAAQRNAKGYSGAFVLDDKTYYSLRPITKIMGKNGPANMPFGSIGFEILDHQNEFVAAVSTMDRGMVYFNTTDNREKFLLANLCAALLLQEEIAE